MISPSRTPDPQKSAPARRRVLRGGGPCAANRIVKKTDARGIATDSLGAVTTSAARTVTVSDTNLPPTVSLTAPANNAAFIAPATITLTANAAAPEANGTVASVEFLANGSPIGSSTTKPYTLAWAVTTPGSYQFSARATDEQGAQTTSALRTVTVLANQAPSISLTSPTANQSFAAPATIQLTAEASDPDNALAKVEFFQNGNLIATVLSPPYASTWENVTAGSYQITAKATDALGAETSTAPITIGVANAQAGVFYLHTDHLNTPRLVTDEANRIVWRNQPTTEPFGNSPVEEDPDGDGTPFTLNLRFPGQYADRETNTHYNDQRDGYDPATGRYTQFDPIGLAGGINGYGYVRGNPVSLIDPDGLCDVICRMALRNGGFNPNPPPPPPPTNLTGSLSLNVQFGRIGVVPVGISLACTVSNGRLTSIYTGAGVVAGSSVAVSPRAAAGPQMSYGNPYGLGVRTSISVPVGGTPFVYGTSAFYGPSGSSYNPANAQLGGGLSGSATFGYNQRF